MAKEEQVVLKRTTITNNCTECFSQDLELTFFQKSMLSPFYRRITDVVTHRLQCKKCDSVLHPVNWTDDIERVLEYYKKQISPKPRSIRFTLLFFAIILGLIAIVATLAYLYYEGII